MKYYKIYGNTSTYYKGKLIVPGHAVPVRDEDAQEFEKLFAHRLKNPNIDASKPATNEAPGKIINSDNPGVEPSKIVAEEDDKAPDVEITPKNKSPVDNSEDNNDIESIVSEVAEAYEQDDDENIDPGVSEAEDEQGEVDTVQPTVTRRNSKGNKHGKSKK
jgi:hypothetical protein